MCALLRVNERQLDFVVVNLPKYLLYLFLDFWIDCDGHKFGAHRSNSPELKLGGVCDRVANSRIVIVNVKEGHASQYR